MGKFSQQFLLLGAYDLGGATFSPIVGLSYLNNTNFGTDAHGEFDFDVLNVNFAGVFQIGRTWSLRPTLNFNNFSVTQVLHNSLHRLHSVSPSVFYLHNHLSIGLWGTVLKTMIGYLNPISIISFNQLGLGVLPYQLAI